MRFWPSAPTAGSGKAADCMQAGDCDETAPRPSKFNSFPTASHLPCPSTEDRMTHRILPVMLAAALAALSASPALADPPGTVEWPFYGNDPGGQRYSPLSQINRDNVSRLEVAWIYHTGDVSNGDTTPSKTGFENTPIVVDGTMYISTPFCRV